MCFFIKRAIKYFLYIYVKDLIKLDNINIKVPEEKIIGLIDENGAGKTTLLKCILDIVHPDKGIVELFNHIL